MKILVIGSSPRHIQYNGIRRAGIRFDLIPVHLAAVKSVLVRLGNKVPRLVSILVYVAYYAYIQYQCQVAKDRYEQAVDSFRLSLRGKYLALFHVSAGTAAGRARRTRRAIRPGR